MSCLSTNPANQDRWVIIYPSYINSKKKICEGRRIARDKACDNPTVNEIKDVCINQGFNCTVENKQYTRDSAKDALCKGRVRIQLKNEDGHPVNLDFPTRKALYFFVASMIPKLKSRQNKTQQSETAGSQANAVTSSKKKKGKKGKGK